MIDIGIGSVAVNNLADLILQVHSAYKVHSGGSPESPTQVNQNPPFNS